MRSLTCILLIAINLMVVPAAAQEGEVDNPGPDADVIREVHDAGPQDPEDYLDPSFEAHVDTYYSPCRGGTEAVIFSWHGKNMDDLPPFDADRQAIHFYCEDRDLYAPTDGIIWNTTMRYGGMVFIDDMENNTCLIFLGMESIHDELAQDAPIEAGEYLGKYQYKIHVAVTQGTCLDANWYDPAARELEVPVAYVEMGDVLRNDLREDAAVPFISENPSGELADDSETDEDQENSE